MFNRLVRFFLENRLITFLFLAVFVIYGIVVMPFHWQTGVLPRDPVPVDAIPDIGENQQIVATEWMGRSPKDIQDQVTYTRDSIPSSFCILSQSGFGFLH